MTTSLERATPDDRANEDDRVETRKKRLELVAVIILSITTVLTAWSAFQSSKWSGAMSIAFSEASAARIESASLQGTANARITNQIGLWTQWAGATAVENSELATFLFDRFPEPLATAHADWLAAGGTAADAPASPFDMPSFVVPEQVRAAASSDRAGQLFQTALRYNQRGDNYTILTVLFATVLFFAALSGRVRAVQAQQVVIGTALVFGVTGVVLLATFPKLI
jgi:hypothetical protein